jgi:hypothetical protein
MFSQPKQRRPIYHLTEPVVNPEIKICNRSRPWHGFPSPPMLLMGGEG